MACSKDEVEIIPSWPHKIDESRKITKSDELFLRQEATSFLLELGRSINLSDAIIFSAVVYFQRFFDLHPFNLFDRFTIAATCLIIAQDCVGDFGKFPFDFEIPEGWPNVPKESLQKSELSSFYMIVYTDLLDVIDSFRIELPQMHISTFLTMFEKVEGISTVTTKANYLVSIVMIAVPSSLSYPVTAIATVCLRIAFGMLGIELESPFKETWSTSLDDLEDKCLQELVDIIVKELTLYPDTFFHKIREFLIGQKQMIAPFCRTLSTTKMCCQSLKETKTKLQAEELKSDSTLTLTSSQASLEVCNELLDELKCLSVTDEKELNRSSSSTSTATEDDSTENKDLN